MVAQRGKYWVFTLNNYTLVEEKELETLVDTDSSVGYVAYGQEVGENGTPHLQGYLELLIKQRLGGVKQLPGFGRAHLELRKGTQKEALDYTKKDGIFFEWGVLFATKQGSRSDLEEVKSLLDSGGSIADVAAQHFGSYIRYRKSFSAYSDLRPESQRDVSVYILWGEPGVGKTRYVFDRYPDVWISSDPTLQWFDGYEGESTVLLDDFRGECSPSFLLRLLDRYPLRVPIKGGFRHWRATKIFITSNDPAPWALANIAAPLARRVKKTVHFSGSLNFEDEVDMARMDHLLN